MSISMGFTSSVLRVRVRGIDRHGRGGVTEIHRMSAADLAEAYRTRRLSPVEVMEATLARAALVQQALCPFRLLDEAGAREAASASEARWAKHDPLSPLDGVPLAIKDNHAARGMPKQSGSRTREPVAEREDAPMVARLREAGCVIFARTTMPDLGWKGVNDSPLTGVTRNPWNPERTPGGSSGGAAVAVATGVCPIATGGDGGGSIRMPAGFTGVFGIKPTTGRVPGLYDSPAGDLVAPGPLSRKVADAALALAWMARPDPRDPIASAVPAPHYPSVLAEGVKGLRVAVSSTLGFAPPVDGARTAALEGAARALAAAGAAVTWEDPPLWNARPVFVTLWEAAYASAVMTTPAERLTLFDPGLLDVARRGLALSAVAEKLAQAERTRFTHAMIAFHQRYDLLLCPTLPVGAFRAGHGVNTPDPAQWPEWYDWTPYTWPFNLTRQPCASVPWGLDGEGLPVGVQLIAAHFREDLVLRGSAALEAAQPMAMPEDELWKK
jgi:aspartyl-tRNA(Asn)/glutamyl-tRNA(Gln) amidotransferase subunit A